MARSQITILHGENLSQSRKGLVDLIEELKAGGYQIARLDGNKLSLGELESTLGSDSLFEDDQVVVIEELHSLPRSKKKTELIEMIAACTSKPIILWEKRALTATMLKQFPGAKSTEFKLSKNLFRWLDSLGEPPQRILPIQKLVLAEDGAELALVMLMRQVRLLIEVKSGGKPAGPPFMVKKLSGQAQKFALADLTSLHTQLLKLDLKNKTGAAKLSLSQALDLLVVGDLK